MKFLIVLVAVVALVSAAAIEKEKEKQSDDKPREEKPRLQWPMPDPVSEGDLMLHGSISFDRVRDLHKAKVEDETDKMILAHGRQFLQRVSKYFDDNADLKIMPVICKDSRTLNSTNNRWRIEIPKQAAPAEPKQAAKEGKQRDSPLPKDKQADSKKAEKVNDQPISNNLTSSNETENVTTTLAPISSSEGPASSSERPLSTSERPIASSSDRPLSSSSDRPSSEKPAEKSSTEKPVEKSSTTLKPEIEKPVAEKETYETRRREFNRQVGTNFARLLMREYRKEELSKEETEYLARWVNDEAVHYGALAIYCNEGENVQEIKKQLVAFLEEKSQ